MGASCSKLCTEEWKEYVDQFKLQDKWEIVLDDTRDMEINYTMGDFLAKSADIFENLFLGCENILSDDLHAAFVDIIVKRLETIISRC